MPKITLAVIVLAVVGVHGSSLAAVTPGEAAQAEAARKKPLQRCDQLDGAAELECLKKARERIVEARKKRESSGEREDKKLVQKSGEKEPVPKK